MLLLLALPAHALGGTASPGLLRYLHGEDRQAIAMLAEEAASGDGSDYTLLALSDLYLIQGDLDAARATLEAVGEEASTSILGSVQVWLTWIDFEQGRYAAATHTLEDIMATLPATDTGAEAALTLGWQRLLTGRYMEAAKTFGTLTRRQDGAQHWPSFRDQALLLEGEALMWSGQLDDARKQLSAIRQEQRYSTVGDDAARDLAWIDYLQGETERSGRELLKVTRRFRGVHYHRRDALAVDWTALAQHGPAIVADEIRRAYRRRPRGQFPLQFLLSIGDRYAADDARQLRKLIAKGRIDAGSRAVASGTLASPPTLSLGVAAEDAPPQVTAFARVFHAQRTLVPWWIVMLIALGMICVIGRWRLKGAPRARD